MTVPTGWSFSPTGSASAPISFMMRAAAWIVSTGDTSSEVSRRASGLSVLAMKSLSSPIVVAAASDRATARHRRG
jgi:hypothetical protein